MKQKCSEYFESLRVDVKKCKQTVTDNIRNSQTLRELESLIEKNKDLFENKAGEGFDHHKDKFDEKIKKFRFASIIKRKTFYDELIDKIEATRSQTSDLFDNIQELESRLIYVQNEASDILKEQMASLVDCTMKFDVCS